MNAHLRPSVGEKLAARFSELWGHKQIEYTFRRAVMRQYEDFRICTRQALVHTASVLGLALTEEEQQELNEEYQNLQPFPDVIPGVEALNSKGYSLVAFSNGVEVTPRPLLNRAGVLKHLQDVISVDGVKSFKPDPEVYHFLAYLLGTRPSETWLVSSNPFDVIGAKAVGLAAAWIRRKPDARFDPWGIEPHLVAPDLESLAERL
jgi:2-haloacid dehalogenase